MSRRQKNPGVCRICGKTCELSLEHVPPKEAFNKATTIEYTLDMWTFKRSVKGTPRQGGVREYTLCEQCNSDTGSWYGGEYVKWTRIGFDILIGVQQHFADKDEVLVRLWNVYPLRYLKQVVTCFFSVIDTPQAKFALINPAVVAFVLDKHQQCLPEEYRFYLRLCMPTPLTALRRYSVAGKLPVNYAKDENGSIKSLQMGNPSVFSEMTHPPFMLVMTHDTGFAEATEITSFKDFGYNEQVNLDLLLKIGRATNPLPGSFE